jgi:hypothetical protein
LKRGIYIGVALVVLGFVALAYQSLSFTSHYGSLRVDSIEEHNPLPLLPVFGAIAMFAGFVFIALERERSGKRGLWPGDQIIRRKSKED